MNDRTPCVDHEALVTYLYDECEPSERESIAAHVAICRTCADEVQALSDTRAHLASWSPPALALIPAAKIATAAATCAHAGSG